MQDPPIVLLLPASGQHKEPIVHHLWGRLKFGIGRSTFTEISSMILNVKARFREPKPSLWMANYNIGAWMRNLEYKLTMDELHILTIFRNEFVDIEGYFQLSSALFHMHYFYLLGIYVTSLYAVYYKEGKFRGVLHTYNCHNH